MKASLPFKFITAVKNSKHYVVFDYRDRTGKRKRKWVGTELPEKCRKKDLTAKVDEIVADFYREHLEDDTETAETAYVPASSTGKNSASTCEYTFTEFYKMWLEAIKPTVAETTFEGYTHTSHRIIKYFDKNYPDIKLKDVRAIELQKFYNDMYAGGISSNTIKHYHANIHKALKYAVKMDLIMVNESEKN
ncbi:N-terminal phage integrase SAM-like domain-containing protein [Ruminococcus albus]|uniref:N-terminal phage integrase SAM-like domain-containing protein n=1 Tax=Ruminococcus albus TaxID=1264 RepID=UPI0004AEB9EA|nr:N-terminal phage integrase SAM-like domain-containing protein [Ruminococcus albus]